MVIQQFFRFFFLYLIFSFFDFFPTSLSAQPTQFNNISLQQNWLVYDWDAAIYVPYIPQIHTEVKSLTLVLDSGYQKELFLKLNHDDRLDVYIDGNMHYSLLAGEVISLPVNQLKSVTDSSDITIAIRSNKIFKKAPIAYIASKSFSIQDAYSDEDKEFFRYRNKALYENKLLLILIFTTIVLVLTNRSLFNPLLSFTSIDGIIAFFTDNKRGLNAKLNLPILFYLSIIIGSVISISVLILDLDMAFFERFSISSLAFWSIWPVAKKFFLIFGLIFFFIQIKLAVIWTFGRLFNFKNTTYLHMYETIMFGQSFFLLHFILTIVYVFAPYLFDSQLLKIFFIYGFLGVSILVSLKIYRVISFNIVYIISYFCITEFVPALVMVRLF